MPIAAKISFLWAKLAPVFPNRRSPHSRNRSAHSFVAARLSSIRLVRRTSPGLSRGWSRRSHFRNGQRTKSCASQSFWVCATTKSQTSRFCRNEERMSPFAIKALRDKQRSRDFYPGGGVIDGLFPAADFAIDTCADETPGIDGAGHTPDSQPSVFCADTR